MAIKRVWVEDGCIGCGACASTCPDVFYVDGPPSHIRKEVRVDGIESPNSDEKADLKPEFQTSMEAAVREAVDGCPVSVIHCE